MTAITPHNLNQFFLAPDADKNTRSSLKRFHAWLNATGQDWFTADLKAYRDYLLHTAASTTGGKLSPATVKKHLERVRGRYRDLLNSNNVRDLLQSSYEALPPSHPHRQGFSKFEFTQEALIRLANNTQYDRMPVKILQRRDQFDSDFHWLTTDQIDALISLPSRAALIGYRDAAMIALAYCCGLREAELCSVAVEDLRQSSGGQQALRVRRGKGMVERAVLYGDMEEYTIYVDEWLTLSGITTGLAFRALDATGQHIIGESVTPRAFAYRLAACPVDGITVQPHDLRRSYALHLYEAGMPVEAIMQQLGHKQITTTMRYIGLLSSDRRAPRLNY